MAAVASLALVVGVACGRAPQLRGAFTTLWEPVELDGEWQRGIIAPLLDGRVIELHSPEARAIAPDGSYEVWQLSTGVQSVTAVADLGDVLLAQHDTVSRSTDGGATWDPVDLDGHTVFDIAADPDTLYALVETPQDGMAALWASDDGLEWREEAAGLSAGGFTVEFGDIRSTAAGVSLLVGREQPLTTSIYRVDGGQVEEWGGSNVPTDAIVEHEVIFRSPGGLGITHAEVAYVRGKHAWNASKFGITRRNDLLVRADDLDWVHVAGAYVDYTFRSQGVSHQWNLAGFDADGHLYAYDSGAIGPVRTTHAFESGAFDDSELEQGEGCRRRYLDWDALDEAVGWADLTIDNQLDEPVVVLRPNPGSTTLPTAVGDHVADPGETLQVSVREPLLLVLSQSGVCYWAGHTSDVPATLTIP